MDAARLRSTIKETSSLTRPSWRPSWAWHPIRTAPRTSYWPYLYGLFAAIGFPAALRNPSSAHKAIPIIHWPMHSH